MSSCFFVPPAQGKTRVITKSVKQESFFQFFESVLGTTQCTRAHAHAHAHTHTHTHTHTQTALVSVLTFSLCAVSDPNEVEDPEDEEEQEKRALDFTRGEFFRDTFVPRALLYFTGEADQGEVCACVVCMSLHLCACVDHMLVSSSFPCMLFLLQCHRHALRTLMTMTTMTTLVRRATQMKKPILIISYRQMEDSRRSASSSNGWGGEDCRDQGQN